VLPVIEVGRVKYCGMRVDSPNTITTEANSNLLKQVLTPEDVQIRPKHVVILKF
jgi:hypothetical protein